MTTTTQRHRTLLRDDVGRRDWMELVKGVAIILVLLYHCMLFLRSIEVEGGGMGRAKLAIELFPMPAFFLIAGVFHHRVKSWSLRDTWKRRMAIYLYLYLLWSVIRFLYYLAIPNVRSDEGAGADASNPLALALAVVWPSSSYWFIYALFVFTFVLWLVRKLPVWLPIAGSAVISVLFSSGLVSVHNVGWDRIGEYLVFFVGGALLSERVVRGVTQTRWWMVALAVVVYVPIAAAVAGLIPPLRGIGQVPGVALVGQLAAVAAAAGLAWYLVRLRPLGWLSYVGERSFHIYLLHIFVIAGLASIVRTIPDLDLLPGRGFLVLGVMAVLVLVISLLLGRLLARVPWLFVPPRALRGRRRPRERKAASTP